MSTAPFYESQAARCRQYAAKSRDPEAIKRWLQLALEYEQLAESTASVPQVADGAHHVQRVPMQAAEIQQQQKSSSSRNPAAAEIQQQQKSSSSRARAARKD
jgi:hypothetical protein